MHTVDESSGGNLLSKENMSVDTSLGKSILDENLIKKVCDIVKLKEKKSKHLATALHELKAEYGSYRSVAKLLDISWGKFQGLYLIRKRPKKVYKHKISEEIKQEIEKFCFDGPATISLPEAQHAGKVFFNRSLKEATEMFNSGGYINRSISVSTFRKFLPKKKVKLQRNIPLRSALCEVCVNFKLLCQGLTGSSLKGIVCKAKDAVCETFCPFEHLKNDADESQRKIGHFGFYQCVFRECSHCGVKLLRSKIEEANASLELNRNVQWFAWESVQKTRVRRGKKVEVNSVERNKKIGTLEELLDLYLNAVEKMSIHLFFSAWQYGQVMEFRSNLQKGQVLCSHDFSKNVSCTLQEEIQSHYYERNLITLHPSVLFYRCDVEGCSEVIRHEIIHLSPNLRHDANAFKKFHCESIAMVEAKVNYDIDLVVNVTDQAPSQYKNKKSFLFTSGYSKPMIHMFLGSRHGKFFSDSSAGRFLIFLRQAITNDRVHIKCAKDLADFAKKEYATPPVESGTCQHYCVSINLVNKIPFSKMDDAVTVDETRLVHAVKNVGKIGVVEKRAIGCLCPPCISGDRPCKYPEYFQPWVRESVSKPEYHLTIFSW